MTLPTPMQVIMNLLPPKDSSSLNPSFIEGDWLIIGTTDPKNTEEITLEVWDSQGNLIEIGQDDPEQDPSDPVLVTRLERAGEKLAGTTISLKVDWDDSAGESYSYPEVKVDVISSLSDILPQKPSIAAAVEEVQPKTIITTAGNKAMQVPVMEPNTSVENQAGGAKPASPQA